MKARYCQALTALAAGFVASAAFAPLEAQANRAIDPNAPRLVVTVFRSADKTSGVQAADAIRTRITQDVPVKNLWVLPKQDINNNLEASGFPTNEALNMNDARQLAQLLRGDMFITGNVVRDSAGMRVDAQYVLTRDASLIQPLGSFRVSKPDQAAGAVSKAFQEAQKAFVSEKNCVNRARESKWEEAKAEARKGIAQYSNTTLARICLANVLVEQKASPDSILAVTTEVLAIDPRSKPALSTAYTALKAANRGPEATDVLLRLVAADPANTKNVEAVVNELAIGGQAAKAQPFVDQLVRDNPGDPNYLSLQMRVHLAAKDYKGGIAAGEELLKADTAYATPELFTRLAAAASVDSQPQKASALMAQALAKFPTNADLLTYYVGILQQAGQTQQALEVIGRALAANPRAAGLNIERARIFATMNQPDSSIAAARAALAAGDSASTVAPFIVAAGQKLMSAAKTADDYRRVIPIFEEANKLAETPAGHLLLGQAHFQVGYQAYQALVPLSRSSKAADRAQACDFAKQAQAAFAVAQVEIPAGGRVAPQQAQQLLTALGQMSPAADQAKTQLCK